MGNFKEDIAKVRALVFDVDGVLTDGGITPTADGDFIRTYNAKDGYAIGYALKMGYLVTIITGGIGSSLENRFRRLGVTQLHINIPRKLPVLQKFMEEYSLTPEQVLYMGDDIPDLGPMGYVGVPVCPADAAIDVIEASRYVSQFGGGQGCARDIIEQVLRSRDDWAKSYNGIEFFDPLDPSLNKDEKEIKSV